MTAFAQVLDRHSTSRGLDVVRVTTEPSRGDVVGIVRNRTTGDEEYLAVRVEPQAPHRITWLPAVSPQERLQEIGAYLKRMGDAAFIALARDCASGITSLTVPRAKRNNSYRRD